MTKPKTPHASAPPRARSTGKARATPGKAPRRTTPYDEKVKAAALDVLREEGLSAAHHATGVPKATLSRWARLERIDLGALARARTANATDAVVAKAAEVRLTTVELLERHLDAAGNYLRHIAEANVEAADLIAGLDPDSITMAVGLTGPYAVISDEQAEAAQLRAMALAQLPLAVRDAEGIVTRAIHDLALLKGEATERGELVVNFGGIPRPNPAGTDDQVIDVDVEEDALGIEPAR